MKKLEKHRIVLVRDGENRADARGQFCGWLDCPLSEKGQEEATAAGKALKFSGLHFHSAHTSLLTRARTTLDIILGFLNQNRIILEKNWRLNERQMGALTGMKMFDAVSKYGIEKVNKWRFSVDDVPPEMNSSHKHYLSTLGDARYKEDPGENEIPKAESLTTMWSRVLPYWDNAIIPHLKGKKTVLIITHGDVIRGIVKFLDRLSDGVIQETSYLPGVPMVYDLDDDFNPTRPVYFLGDHDLIVKAMAATHERNKNRAEASLNRAQELNSMVEVIADTEKVEDKPELFFSNFDVVVATECSTKQYVHLDQVCREKGIKFFCGDVYGFFGYLFLDLQIQEFVEEVPVIECPSSSSGEPRAKKAKTEKQILTKKCTETYVPLQDALDVDWTCETYQKRLRRMDPSYFVMKGLQIFRDKNGRKPLPSERLKDLEELKKLVEDELKKNSISHNFVPDELLKNIFGEISPVCAILGGITAQEIIKTVSQKERPHNNIFFFNHLKCIGYSACFGV